MEILVLQSYFHFCNISTLNWAIRTALIDGGVIEQSLLFWTHNWTSCKVMTAHPPQGGCYASPAAHVGLADLLESERMEAFGGDDSPTSSLARCLELHARERMHWTPRGLALITTGASAVVLHPARLGAPCSVAVTVPCCLPPNGPPVAECGGLPRTTPSAFLTSLLQSAKSAVKAKVASSTSTTSGSATVHRTHIWTCLRWCNDVDLALGTNLGALALVDVRDDASIALPYIEWLRASSAESPPSFSTGAAVISLRHLPSIETESRRVVCLQADSTLTILSVPPATARGSRRTDDASRSAAGTTTTRLFSQRLCNQPTSCFYWGGSHSVAPSDAFARSLLTLSSLAAATSIVSSSTSSLSPNTPEHSLLLHDGGDGSVYRLDVHRSGSKAASVVTVEAVHDPWIPPRPRRRASTPSSPESLSNSFDVAAGLSPQPEPIVDVVWADASSTSPSLAYVALPSFVVLLDAQLGCKLDLEFIWQTRANVHFVRLFLLSHSNSGEQLAAGNQKDGDVLEAEADDFLLCSIDSDHRITAWRHNGYVVHDDRKKFISYSCPLVATISGGMATGAHPPPRLPLAVEQSDSDRRRFAVLYTDGALALWTFCPNSKLWNMTQCASGTSGWGDRSLTHHHGSLSAPNSQPLDSAAAIAPRHHLRFGTVTVSRDRRSLSVLRDVDVAVALSFDVVATPTILIVAMDCHPCDPNALVWVATLDAGRGHGASTSSAAPPASSDLGWLQVSGVSLDSRYSEGVLFPARRVSPNGALLDIAVSPVFPYILLRYERGYYEVWSTKTLPGSLVFAPGNPSPNISATWARYSSKAAGDACSLIVLRHDRTMHVLTVHEDHGIDAGAAAGSDGAVTVVKVASYGNRIGCGSGAVSGGSPVDSDPAISPVRASTGTSSWFTSTPRPTSTATSAVTFSGGLRSVVAVERYVAYAIADTIVLVCVADGSVVIVATPGNRRVTRLLPFWAASSHRILALFEHGGCGCFDTRRGDWTWPVVGGAMGPAFSDTITCAVWIARDAVVAFAGPLGSIAVVPVPIDDGTRQGISCAPTYRPPASSLSETGDVSLALSTEGRGHFATCASFAHRHVHYANALAAVAEATISIISSGPQSVHPSLHRDEQRPPGSDHYEQCLKSLVSVAANFEEAHRVRLWSTVCLSKTSSADRLAALRERLRAQQLSLCELRKRHLATVTVEDDTSDASPFAWREGGRQRMISVTAHDWLVLGRRNDACALLLTCDQSTETSRIISAFAMALAPGGGQGGPAEGESGAATKQNRSGSREANRDGQSDATDTKVSERQPTEESDAATRTRLHIKRTAAKLHAQGETHAAVEALMLVDECSAASVFLLSSERHWEALLFVLVAAAATADDVHSVAAAVVRHLTMSQNYQRTAAELLLQFGEAHAALYLLSLDPAHHDLESAVLAMALYAESAVRWRSATDAAASMSLPLPCNEKKVLDCIRPEYREAVSCLSHRAVGPAIVTSLNEPVGVLYARCVAHYADRAAATLSASTTDLQTLKNLAALMRGEFPF